MLDELNAEDRKTFEERINKDPKLQAMVEEQKALLKGLNRHQMRQKIKKAKKSYHTMKTIKSILLGAATILVVAASYYYFTNQEFLENKLPELNENGEKLWADADKYIESQKFKIYNEDTLLVSKNGVIISIPKDAFLSKSQGEIEGPFEIEFKEAMTPDEIMRGGLNTKSGSDLLETGGMFYLNAKKNGEQLYFNPYEKVAIDVPTNDPKEEMQLFKGMRQADGSIDWQDPTPIINPLHPIDIMKMDLYPPNYLDTVHVLRKDAKDKRYTDSLYYSFGALFEQKITSEAFVSDTIESLGSLEAILGNGHGDFGYASDKISSAQLFKANCATCHSAGTKMGTGPGLAGFWNKIPYETEQEKKDWYLKWVKNPAGLIAEGNSYAISLREPYPTLMTGQSHLSDDEIMAIKDYLVGGESIKGINPIKIQSIWDKRYNNTLLATQEFQNRLPFIHKTCDGSVLDLYVNQLNNNLYEIDEMVCNKLGASHEFYPIFKNFASKMQGKVELKHRAFEKLNKLYEKRQMALQEAVNKTNAKYYKEDALADQKALQKKSEQHIAEHNREAFNYQKEYDLNLKETCKQLGVVKNLPISEDAYRLVINDPGWINIDRIVAEQTKNRETISITDTISGKTATIKYEPFEVEVKDKANYDRVYAYLLPQEWNSFQRMNDSGTYYHENLNELINYSYCIVGYKGADVYWNYGKEIKSQNISVSLEKTKSSKIKSVIGRNSSNEMKNEMVRDLNFHLFEFEEARRLDKVKSDQELRKKIKETIFPCFTMVEEVGPEQYNMELN